MQTDLERRLFQQVEALIAYCYDKHGWRGTENMKNIITVIGPICITLKEMKGGVGCAANDVKG